MSTVQALPIPLPFDDLAFNLRLFLREAGFEFLSLSRSRSFALSIIGFPVVFYLFFGLIMNRGEHIGSLSAAKYMLAGYTIFGMVGASLFGVGVSLASALAAGWLDLKRASPMPPLAYILAKCLSAMAFGIIIVSLLTAMGIGIGHVSITFPEYLRMIGLTCIGVLPFACMGMALALLVPFNAAPGIANMIYLPMSFLGGLWVPIMFLPKFLQTVATLLPTYHLAQLMLGAFGYQSSGSTMSHWIGLLCFTSLMIVVVLLAFRRHERDS